MKLLVVADCWEPYVSGFVRTFSTTVEHLRRRGHEVDVISPDMFWTVPFPLYPEFPVPVWVTRKVVRLIEDCQPEAIHLAAEGPLGLAARRWCLRQQVPFTTSFTTKQPEHFHAWCGFPISYGYKLLRWFHARSAAVMVPTPSVMEELGDWGFQNLVLWTRGVDLDLFRPRPPGFLSDPRPIMLYAGRVSKEKNIPEFLDLRIPGTKIVVGAGPICKTLSKDYPHVRFAGLQRGTQLAEYYAAADVLVFPSRTDTFGLVMLEALASGTPVAAHRVSGPSDVLGNSDAGALDDDLERAVQRALKIPGHKCRAFAEEFSWENSVDQFLANLHPFTGLGPFIRDQAEHKSPHQRDQSSGFESLEGVS